MLKETILDEDIEPVVSNIWRASEAGELCETYLCRTRLGEQPLKLPGRMRHLLDDGNMHEKDIVNRLKSGGLNVLYSGEDQLYVHCVGGDIKINGHPDGVLKNIPVELRQLDYADEHFSWDSTYHLLEITAPNHFSFIKYYDDHLRGVNWRKFAQTNLYLGSEELKDKMHCAVVEVKDKMSSRLYEEGLTFDQAIVDQTVERLKRVEDLVSKGQVSSRRCSDWHKNACKFRHLCFNAEGEADNGEVTPTKGFLNADKLLEAEQLREALRAYREGKELEGEGKAMAEEARYYFGDILTEYNIEGVFIDETKIHWIDGTYSGVDVDLLKTSYPKVFAAVDKSHTTRYVSVGRARKQL